MIRICAYIHGQALYQIRSSHASSSLKKLLIVRCLSTSVDLKNVHECKDKYYTNIHHEI